MVLHAIMVNKYEDVAIWIKRSIIDLATECDKVPRRSSTSLRPPNATEKLYEWVFAYLISTQDEKQGITVLVDDETCPKHNKKEIFISSQTKNNSNLMKEDFYVKANMQSLSNDWINQQHLPQNDLTNLTHINEPSVVQILFDQYQKSNIYTTAGNILLSVNPNKPCPQLYDNECVEKYCKNGENSTDRLDKTFASTKLPPHIFSIADYAFRSMMFAMACRDSDLSKKENDDNGYNIGQTILISGESGAGKTFCTKIILQYLANLSENIIMKDKKSFAFNQMESATNVRVEQKGKYKKMRIVFFFFFCRYSFESTLV